MLQCIVNIQQAATKTHDSQIKKYIYIYIYLFKAIWSKGMEKGQVNICCQVGQSFMKEMSLHTDYKEWKRFGKAE